MPPWSRARRPGPAGRPGPRRAAPRRAGLVRPVAPRSARALAPGRLRTCGSPVDMVRMNRAGHTSRRWRGGISGFGLAGFCRARHVQAVSFRENRADGRVRSSGIPRRSPSRLLDAPLTGSYVHAVHRMDSSCRHLFPTARRRAQGRTGWSEDGWREGPTPAASQSTTRRRRVARDTGRWNGVVHRGRQAGRPATGRATRRRPAGGARRGSAPGPGSGPGGRPRSGGR